MFAVATGKCRPDAALGCAVGQRKVPDARRSPEPTEGKRQSIQVPQQCNRNAEARRETVRAR